MEKIIVNVEWYDKNFGASLSDNVPGAVVLTAKTYDELLISVPETLRFHVQGMLDDGDVVPQWLADGNYEFEYVLDTTALIHVCDTYTSLAAISRASGINQHLLSHYANGLNKPRPQQRDCIVDGIRKIGNELLEIL